MTVRPGHEPSPQAHGHRSRRTSATQDSSKPSVRAEWALDRLARGGGRRTVAHVSVLEVLTHVDDHLSVQEIYEPITDHPSLSRSTVHRIIGRLIAAGLVHVLPVPGEARYGLNDHAHAHAICSMCGRVQELSDESLATIMGVVEHQTGFAVAPSGVGVQGLCPECQAAQGPHRGIDDPADRQLLN